MDAQPNRCITKGLSFQEKLYMKAEAHGQVGNHPKASSQEEHDLGAELYTPSLMQNSSHI